jgi:hypothetical protein
VQFVNDESKEIEMCTKLIALVVTLMTLGFASTANAGPTTPTSPGACNMLNTAAVGMDGMQNDPHFSDIMYPLVLTSLAAGCNPANPR